MKPMVKKLSFSLFLVIIGLTLNAQSPNRSELEKERADIQRQIEDVRRSLNETQKNRKETLGQLRLLQRKLALREKAIRNINKQINVIDAQVNQSWRDILRLRRELDTLKLQYEKSVVYAYKNRSNYDFLNFIFSSTSFNDALKRVEYMKSYRNYREQQAENINRAQEQLNQRVAGLKVHREEKNLVLKAQNDEKTHLVVEKREKDRVNAKLRSREKELNKDLAAKKKQDSKLKSAIAAAIRREIEAEKKRQASLAKTEAPKTNTESGTTATTTKSTTSKTLSPFDASPTERLASDNFEKNKRKLPWPIEAGNVTMEFGRHKVMEDSNIEYDNSGLTIETRVGASVKVIFDGEVSSVFNVGDVTAVIVRHGKYFTSYSGLSSASVRKGQDVKMGDVLGRMAEKADNVGELEFIIMNDKMSYLSPRSWLR
jgi:septal ring factor EnvC (AmiA/AmiB activator)